VTVRSRKSPTVQLRSLSRRLRQQSARLITQARATLRKYLPNEAQHLFALTLAVGVVCGLVAVAFHISIQLASHLLIDRALSAPGRSWIAWTIVCPTLAGLIAGALLTWVVPNARGSGIPQVKQAFAIEGGRIRFRDSVGKFVVGVLQIGAGASLGREGPTVQICAGATSMLARLTSLPPKSARRLLPVAVAAGIAAAFNAPIAAVTFTIEEIVGALDQTVLSGVVIAAALAAVIERSVLGVHPVIEVAQSYGLDHPSSLAFYALLGIAAALVSIAFTDSLLKLRLWFRRLRWLPSWMQPAVGGLVTGLLAVAALHFFGVRGVTGGGYETLGQALAGALALKVLVALCIIKLVATVFSYSSGGAGGIFAPALFVGAMLGGAVGFLDVAAFHHEERQLGAFALVGMGAVFAGVIRAPITSVLIIFEMTGGYGLVLPLMLANMTAFVLTRHWRPTSVYDALLAQDGVILPHGSPRAHPVDQLAVADAMTSPAVSVRVTQTVREALDLVRDRHFALLPAINDIGALVGIVRVSRLRAAANSGDGTAQLSTLLEPARTVISDASLIRSIVQMNDAGVRQFVVVEDVQASHLVGVIAISDFVRAHARFVPAPTDTPLGTRSARPPASRRAQQLMVPAAVVPGATKLDALLEELVASPGKALIVEGPASEYAVVLLEYVREVGRDDELHNVLIAADVARRMPVVVQTADLSEVVRAFSAGSPDALLVTESRAGSPVGVVTRGALADVLLEWYATQARASPRENTGPEA
jgi:CIC family chloride channel protein